MSAAPYRPRHAVTAEERRRLAAQPADDTARPARRRLRAVFRDDPRRARRMVLAALGIAASVLVASTVASAAADKHGRQHRTAGTPVPVRSGERAPAGRATGPTSGAAPTGASAATTVLGSRAKAPVTKAVISGLAANGIPNVALNAYRVAADRMAHVQPSCGIDWALLAGIGREESDHGRFGGARLNPDGTTTPHIVGPALDGVGNQYIAAPHDGYALDGDRTYTHALGPMQFIPQTWAVYGVDANGDGRADVFNINDAALGAARYLCANGGNLRTPAGQVRAVLAYNHSDQYVSQVLALADAYRLGLPVKGIPVGNITGALPPISAPGPYAVNPGPPTAIIGTAAAAVPSSGRKPGSGRPRGTSTGTPAGGATTGRKQRGPAGATTTPSKPTSGSSSGSGAGSKQGSSSAPTPAPSSPTERRLPLPLPTKLPTLLPTLPAAPSASPTTAGPKPTCVLGVNGVCVVP